MLTQDRLSELFERFGHTQVLLIGDVMLDHYLWGTIERMSPEAPVPVVLVSKEETRLGGAANVALNLMALGTQVSLCALTGDDADGKTLRALLNEEGIATEGIIKSASRPTTKKSRVIDGQKQVVRYDLESSEALSEQEEAALLQSIQWHLKHQPPDVVVFQDYNKGLLTANVIDHVIAYCREHNIPTCVDPKKDNFFAYKGCSLFKPNLKEVREALETTIDLVNDDSLNAAEALIQEKMEHAATMITLSDKGIFVSSNEGAGSIYTPKPRNIVDVSGAGDTVIAVAGLGIANGMALDEMAILANIAGGQVCEKPGVVPIDKATFYSEALLLTDD